MLGNFGGLNRSTTSLSLANTTAIDSLGGVLNSLARALKRGGTAFLSVKRTTLASDESLLMKSLMFLVVRVVLWEGSRRESQ